MNHRTKEQGTRNDEGTGKCAMRNAQRSKLKEDGIWASEKAYE
jgi:hypothetical protein